MQRQAARRDVFERYIGEISKAIHAINGADAKKLYDKLLAEARKRTAIADAQLDEEGKTVDKDDAEDLKDDEGVVMVQSRAGQLDETSSDSLVSNDNKSTKSKKKPSQNDGELF